MDAARLPDGLPSALQELGMASLLAIGTTDAKEGLRRALAGQMSEDDAVALSADVLDLARAITPRR